MNRFVTTCAFFSCVVRRYETKFAVYVLLRHPKQKSRPIRLVRGKAYYLEAVMKEGKGGDHISVGVRLPGRLRPKPISKEDVYVRPPGKPLHNSLHSTLLHSTLLYSTLLYSTLLYSTLLYSTLLYSTLLYSTLLYSTLLYSTLLYSTVMNFTVLSCAVLCCAVLCCAVLCCAVLCCAVLCCAVLCCAVLCCAVLCCASLYCAKDTIKMCHSAKIMSDIFL